MKKFFRYLYQRIKQLWKMLFNRITFGTIDYFIRRNILNSIPANYNIEATKDEVALLWIKYELGFDNASSITIQFERDRDDIKCSMIGMTGLLDAGLTGNTLTDIQAKLNASKSHLLNIWK